MRDRRVGASRRPCGAALVLTIVCASFFGGPYTLAEGHGRVLPANAVQPPGASFEGYPAVGRRQRAEILREAVKASVRSLARTPLRSSAQLTARTAERLAVRAGEVATLAGIHPPRCDGGASRDIGGGDGGPPTPAAISLLTTSEAAVRALLDLIPTATARIDLMMYGWEDDPTGREVASALAGAAGRGVRVRLLVDRTGYLIHNAAAASGRCTFLDELRTVPGVAVIEPSDPFLRFDHRKLAVIDGRAAWTGGMILTEVARRRWHNFAFVAEGPIVAQYAAVFEERWRHVGGRPEGPLAGSGASRPSDATVRLIRTDDRERSLKNTIYHAVDHARRHIYLENPYFSDEILTAKLKSARARGVDVRAVLTLRGNVTLLNRYETLTANRLLKAGVRVYLYPAMTHVKAMSADGEWAYIGTGNFDELSLRNNREVGLSVSTPALVGELDRSFFLPDMAASQELSALLPAPRGRWVLELLSLWY